LHILVKLAVTHDIAEHHHFPLWILFESAQGFAAASLLGLIKAEVVVLRSRRADSFVASADK
jgi:hypothetical protein